MSELKLITENLIKRYDGRKVVDQVNIEIAPGEIVGLLGPNGAGKTTTFRMILGIISPDSGNIFLNGEEITSLPFYRKANKGISYLPQEPSYFRKLTVEGNIKLILENKNINAKKRKEEIDRLLEELDIIQFKRQQASNLSGGEVRKVEIARALATSPSFMLLDEPFSGIDPISVEEIQNIIKYLKDENLGIIVTDHNVRETLSITDYAYLLNKGRILVEGKAYEITNDPQAKKFYLGEKFRM